MSDSPDFVTLDEAAAWVKRTKSTLKKHRKNGCPQPDVKGGGGKPNEWRWSTIRPWLEQEFGRKLPKIIPAGTPDAQLRQIEDRINSAELKSFIGF